MQFHLVSGDKNIQSELSHISTQKHSSDTLQAAGRAEGNFLKGAMFKRPQTHTPSVFLLHLLLTAQRQP